jgi:subtilisin family serine protease
MASPHVAGAIALYLQAHPKATPEQVADDLIGNARHCLIPAWQPVGAASSSPRNGKVAKPNVAGAKRPVQQRSVLKRSKSTRG